MSTDSAAVDDQLQPIKFRQSFSYDRLAPTFVCDSVSGLSEIARWALDLNLVIYKEESHSPRYAAEATSMQSGQQSAHAVPVLISTDALVYSAESILQRLDQSIPSDRRLFPEDPATLAETVRLFRLYTGALNDSASRYIYSELLPDKGNALKLFSQRAPFRERLGCRWGYGFVCQAISAQWDLKSIPAAESLKNIKEIFEQVSNLLGDGRRYLTGDRLTAADIAFASVGAMVTLPMEYGGAITRISQVPAEVRKEILELRATSAGQFVLRMYQEDRPINLPWTVPRQPGLIKRMLGGVKTALSRRQSSLWYFLQRYFPVVNVPCVKLSTVARNDLVVEALERDDDFTIMEINGRKMANQSGAFFLGMDRNDPQFDRERNFVLAASRKEDLDPVREFFRSHAEEITRNAQPFGKLDVANSLCYVVLARLLEDYFGLPNITNSTTKRWSLDLFYDLFLNFTSNKQIHANAVNAANERNAWTLQIIKERKQELKDGKELADNLLNRLIQLSQQPGYEWVSDNTIVRNIGGLLTGAFGTTNKSVIFVLDQLFQRPSQLQGAVAAAEAFDMQKMLGYVSEGLRFSPVQPGVLRFSEDKQFLTGTGKKKYKVKGGRTVVTLTAGAMFDPEKFPEPRTFNPDRDGRYMNWGFALHECYGGFINAISIPELVAAVLRLKNVRRASGREGRATGLTQGPFPNYFVVEFDSPNT